MSATKPAPDYRPGTLGAQLIEAGFAPLREWRCDCGHGQPFGERKAQTCEKCRAMHDESFPLWEHEAMQNRKMTTPEAQRELRLAQHYAFRRNECRCTLADTPTVREMVMRQAEII